ncbi:hypothetical protein ACQKKX_01855 [Neorhizobium sp. NPDC001467]|uniref:hypothetical protein n=1 Tax=Neorhizobium sp. NPDC001467 TaxID=3390595 RepID=UPI003D08870C
MADFVAVIRRAVDGLANNTPEMRLRVYEKARGAVQRQLENMKPRPSDDMLRRQMDKLEAAITSVEAEHAQALPAGEPEVSAGAIAATSDATPMEPQRASEWPREPEPAATPVRDDAASSYSPSAYARGEEPADEDMQGDYPPVSPVSPSYEPQQHDFQSHEPANEPVAYEPPSYEPEPEAARYEPIDDRGLGEQGAADHGADDRYDAAAVDARHDSVPGEPAEVPRWDEPAQPLNAPYPDEPPFGRPAELPETVAYLEDRDRLIPASEPTFPEQTPIWPQDPDAPHADTAHAHDIREPAEGGERDTQNAALSRLVEPMADFDETPTPAQEPGWFTGAATRVEADATPTPAWSDTVELPRATQDDTSSAFAEQRFDDRPASESFDAHFETPVSAAATARMPAAADLPEFGVAPASSSAAASDPFEEYLRSQPDLTTPVAATSAAGATTAATSEAGKPADADPWNDLEELIGYNKAAAAEAEKMPAAEDAELHDDMMPPPVRPYRAQPKPKRSFGPLILAVLGLVIVGGGGYVAWSNWDKVGELVGSIGGSETSETDTAQQTPPATATPPASQTPPVANTPAQTAPADPAAGGATPPAAADGATAGQKFTQRLLANGTEVDEGAGGPAAGGGGQSVAQLNSPPGTPATTPAEATAQAPANVPAVNPTETAAVSGEKMFLYEERLGQPAPTAVEGNVSWSLQNEPGENGRQEPTVQARINIPGRGLTALVTFKRNSDASLPASHLIELVFSVPPDFEGGAIDSVQRIAMKDTEQDRGTPLVAVPAKITDDFHMIALNDFPDARATNLELLRSKNWLDIPLAYRNGRRALLTLQKGQEGIRAFNTAIREWSTATASSGQ